MFKRKNPSIDASPAKLPRNAFDLSERALYTQAPGMLLPVFVKDMNPDEKVTVDIKTQLQAMTLKGRAFSNMQQQFAAYFVPYRVLWSYWQAFISGLSLDNVNTSSLFAKGSTGSNLITPKFRPFDVLARNRSAVDSLGFPFDENFTRLCDLLGYGNIIYPTQTDGLGKFDVSSFGSYEVNGFRMLAYQKIYQDHFLDDRFESRNVDAYNVDKFNPTAPVFSDLENFQLRYAKYNRDFLTNIQPSPLFVSNVNHTIKSFVGAYPTAGVNQFDTVVDVQAKSGDVRNSGIISASTIRNLFALDKMAQISSRAAKTYRAQMLAHYGVKVDDDDKLSKYCGGFSHDLETSTVVATSDGTASDSSTNFGQQGGFIDNVTGGRIEFDSKGDFGVFMILTWISPSLIWDSNGVDEFNCKFRKEDYYHPEFADLGMQPLTTNYIGNLNMSGRVIGVKEYLDRNGFEFLDDPDKSKLTAAFNGLSMSLNSGQVYGWTERYAEYKSAYDKCYGEFKKFSVNPKMFLSGPIGSLSFLTHHAVSKTPLMYTSAGVFSTPKSVTLDIISIRPDVLDDVVEVAYKGHQYEDPFRIETTFSCSMIRNMSVSGLPRLS